ncbi:MAG: DUF4157 domain-containing protein [Bacteroidota bacterium]
MMKRRRHKKNQTEQKDAFFSKSTQAPKSNDAGFFQAKLEIDPVDSPMEREADAAAHQVVHQSSSKTGGETASIQRKKIQRMGKEEEAAAKRIQRQEEEEAAAKLIQRQEEEEAAAKLIQRQEEEEAAAKLIQRQEEEEAAAKLIQRQEEEEAAAKLIQRQEEEEAAAKLIQRQEEEQPAAKLIQKKDEKGAGDATQINVEQMIQMTKGQGNALPDDVRSEMESHFGADFSFVRIHTGNQAIEMTQALNAHAFTHGYDIYFNEGRFDPYAQSGKELLAHELAHVVQQKGTGQ